MRLVPPRPGDDPEWLGRRLLPLPLGLGWRGKAAGSRAGEAKPKTAGDRLGRAGRGGGGGDAGPA